MISDRLEVLHAPAQPGVPPKPHPILFLHGAFAGAWCWEEHFMPWFAARGYASLAVSFRGHAGSVNGGDLHSFGIADYVDDVREIVAAIDPAPILVGHSMGGFVAMRYLETAAAGAAVSLVLMATVPPSGLAGPAMTLGVWNPGLLWEAALLQTMNPQRTSLAAMRRALFATEDDPEVLRRHLNRMSSESRRATTEMYGLVRVDAARLRNTAPILLLGGRQDRLISPPHLRAAAASLDTQAVFFDRTGHGMMLDRSWCDVAAHIADWLDVRGL